MKKMLLKALAILVLLLVIAFFALTNGLAEGTALALEGVTLPTVPDGVYTGTHHYKRWSNTLLVRVEEHRITSIEIVEDVTAAQVTNCSGEVFARVLAAQDTRVDAVTGATVTSKAYLAAIENALNG